MSDTRLARELAEAHLLSQKLAFHLGRWGLCLDMPPLLVNVAVNKTAAIMEAQDDAVKAFEKLSEHMERVESLRKEDQHAQGNVGTENAEV